MGTRKLGPRTTRPETSRPVNEHKSARKRDPVGPCVKTTRTINNYYVMVVKSERGNNGSIVLEYVCWTVSLYMYLLSQIERKNTVLFIYVCLEKYMYIHLMINVCDFVLCWMTIQILGNWRNTLTCHKIISKVCIRF
jgi:hypothetical protein